MLTIADFGQFPESCVSFYQSSDSPSRLREDGFSREWAEQAARLVFNEADRPDEDKIATCTILCMFWYSHGDWQRALVYEGNAIIQLRLTGIAESSQSSEYSIQAESRRRRFWAAYVINEFVSEPAASFSPKTVSKVWLPCEEEDYAQGRVSSPRVRINDDVRTPSIFAEIVRVTNLWSSVYKLISDIEQEPVVRLSALSSMDAELRQWRAYLPHCFSAALLDDTNSDDHRLRVSVLILHVIYHQSMCALHASVVPLISLGAARHFMPYTHAQRLSAQVAYENACTVSSLVSNAVSRYPGDAYQWSGFVGYALYCSCACQLPFLWSDESSISECASKNIKTNLETMAKIGLNWRYVLNLVSYGSVSKPVRET
jgi:hypothetical protein